MALAWAGCCDAAAQEDVFVIRADITYTGSDEYHFVSKYSDGFVGNTRDAQDTFTYHYIGQQTIRLTKPSWKETYENQYAVSGGGSSENVFYNRYGPPKKEELSWSYFFDPEKASESDSDMASLGDTKLTKCSVIPVPSWPIGIEDSLGAGMFGGYGMTTASSLYLVAPGTLHLESIPLPTNTTSYTVTRSYSTNLTVRYSGAGETGQRQGAYHCTIIISRNPVLLEAVIIPDPPPLPVAVLPQYADWMPIAGPNEDTPGTNFMVRVILRPKGSQDREPVSYGRAKFIFQFEDVSREPGLCLNYPAKGKSKSPPGPDLRIHPAEGRLSLSNEDLRAETAKNDLNEASIIVDAFDYGAFGKLTVTAQIPGQGDVTAFVIDHPNQTFLTLPQDENNNHIADSWEKDNSTWGQIQDPKWDQSDLPDGQDADGDGIGLYEKYRGFMFGNAHERLQPQRKHVFVYDPDGLARLNAQSDMSFQAGSLLRVRFVRSDGWTGPGAAANKRRIVNFNTSGFGHAVNQHAEHVRLVATKVPTIPSDYQAVYRAKYGTNSTERVNGAFGLTYPDYSVEKNHWSPEQWVLIECYAWSANDYAEKIVKYHTKGLAPFAGYFTNSPASQAVMDAQIAQQASAYIAAHSDDWEELNWKVMMMAASHEMGHGVAVEDLQPPNTAGPHNCFMRYIGFEFPANPDDRFELSAKWRKAAEWPRIFCHDPAGTVPGKGCFEQIHVTDREGGAAGLARAVRPVDHGLALLSAPFHPPPKPWITMSGETVPPLALSSSLEWETPLAGDPLRVMVRLSAPQTEALWELALLKENSDPLPPSPSISSNWVSGLSMELARLETNGAWKVIVENSTWNAHLREIAANAAIFERLMTSRQREFLLPPAVAQLQPGDYLLRVRWNGAGLVDPLLLPAGGMLQAQDIPFSVLTPSTDAQRATNLRRLAFQAWDTDQNQAAGQFGAEAIRLDPENRDPDALETFFVVASSQLRGGELYGSATTLCSIRNLTRERVFSELAEQTSWLLSTLLPELSVVRPSRGNLPAKLKVSGHIGQRYALQASDDLANWTTVQAVTATANSFVIDGPSDNRDRKFFRLMWFTH